MGREIVRRESLDEPGKRSRLWLPKDINYVLSKNTGTEAIEGIFVDSTDESGVEVDVNAKSFSVMSKLRYLKINCRHLPNGLDYLPNSLRILKWTGYPSKSLPQHFNPEKLRDLSLCHSVNILSTPDFRVMPYLELLTLEVLDVSGCSKLDKLPEELGNIECLVELDVSGTGIRELPSSIGLLKNLQELSFRGCKEQSPKSWNMIFNPFQFLKPLPPSIWSGIYWSLEANGMKSKLDLPALYFGERSGAPPVSGHGAQPVSDHIWFLYAHRDRYFFDNWQDIYYKLEFSFKHYKDLNENVKVKKCGVRMIYEEDAEELRQTLWK
ncbi:hypothetical protein M0R45_008620 [Rubus argutus]|uniref:Uncharacterized protein n=1 Tax=Rubus argutus TaxID=59490 RepID=A0AAW1Y1R0_RUBAR